jgi:hypothetical protein
MTEPRTLVSVRDIRRAAELRKSQRWPKVSQWKSRVGELACRKPEAAGAIPDSNRAKRPSLDRPSAPDLELTAGHRVEGLANFGKPTGEFGTVEQTNKAHAIVKWDDDGQMRLHQPWLKKAGNKVHPLAKPARSQGAPQR